MRDSAKVVPVGGFFTLETHPLDVMVLPLAGQSG